MTMFNSWCLPWKISDDGKIVDNNGNEVNFTTDQIKFIVGFINAYAFNERTVVALIINDGFTTEFTTGDSVFVCEQLNCAGQVVKVGMIENKKARLKHDEELARRHRETTEKEKRC